MLNASPLFTQGLIIMLIFIFTGFGSYGVQNFDGFRHMVPIDPWGMPGFGRQTYRGGHSKIGMINGFPNSLLNRAYMKSKMGGMTKDGLNGFITGGYLKGKVGSIAKGSHNVNAGYPKRGLATRVGEKISTNKIDSTVVGLRESMNIGFPKGRFSGFGNHFIGGMVGGNVGWFDGLNGADLNTPGLGEWNSLATTNFDAEPMGLDRFSNGEFGPFDGTFSITGSQTGQNTLFNKIKKVLQTPTST